MTIKSAAGSQPAAGTPTPAFLSTESTKATMTNQTNSTTANNACLDFALLSNYASQLARTLGMDIVSFPDGFTAVKDGEVISGEYTSKELEAWFNGYESGKDDIEIVVRLDDAKLLLAELIKAEQVIQTMGAQMGDAQRAAANASLITCGLPILGGALCQERRNIIAAARLTIGTAS